MPGIAPGSWALARVLHNGPVELTNTKQLFTARGTLRLVAFWVGAHD